MSYASLESPHLPLLGLWTATKSGKANRVMSTADFPGAREFYKATALQSIARGDAVTAEIRTFRIDGPEEVVESIDCHDLPYCDSELRA